MDEAACHSGAGEWPHAASTGVDLDTGYPLDSVVPSVSLPQALVAQGRSWVFD